MTTPLSKSLKITKIENNWLVPEETIPIKMAEDQNQFQVNAFFNISVTLFT